MTRPALGLALAALALAPAASRGQTVTSIDLGLGWASGINDDGLVVGSRRESLETTTPFLWIGSTAIPLSGPSAFGDAYDVNGPGVVLGSRTDSSGRVPFVIVPEDANGDGSPDTWHRDADADGANDLVRSLGKPAGFYEFAPYAIDDLGRIAGTAFAFEGGAATLLVPRDADGDGRADTWFEDGDGDGANDLYVRVETFPGASADLAAVSERGFVAGTAYGWLVFGGGARRGFVVVPRDADGDGRPDTWSEDADGDGRNDLLHEVCPHAFPGGPRECDAVAVNDRGQVAGATSMWASPDGLSRAFVVTPLDTDADGTPDTWYRDADGDGQSDLVQFMPTPPGGSSVAAAINDRGDAAVTWWKGCMLGGGDVCQIGYAWTGGALVQLALNGSPSAINERGQLAGGLFDPSAEIFRQNRAAVWQVVTTNTPPGSDVTVEPTDPSTGETPITITFSGVTSPGETTVTSSGTGAPPPSGFRLGSPPVYYEIATTAGFTPPVEICISYAGTSVGNEARLRLFHRVGGAWTDVTSSVDTAADVVCGIVDSLSPFALFEGEVEAAIDVKPGSWPNSVNLGSGGSVPVAIFGSAILRAEDVDPLSVTLQSAPVRLKGNGSPMAALSDVDGDGRLDLVVHVTTSTLAVSAAEEEVVLSGRLRDGTWIAGRDTIRVVP